MLKKMTWIDRELGELGDIGAMKGIVKRSFEATFDVRLCPSELSEEERGGIEELVAKYRSEKWVMKKGTRAKRFSR